MKPTEKAKKIACHNCCCSFEDKSKANCMHYNNVWQMHEWIKEQIIEKACEWIKELMIASNNYDAYDMQENLRDFKKAMKGE